MPSNTKNPNASQGAREAMKMSQPMLDDAKKKAARAMAKRRGALGGKVASSTTVVRKMPIPAPSTQVVKKY